MIALSGFHIQRLLSAPRDSRLEISCDLGISTSEVHITDDVLLPDGQRISREVLSQTAKKRDLHDCFGVVDSRLEWLYAFNADRNLACKLYEPQCDWPPTLMIGGAFMHAIATTTPAAEAEEKAKSLRPHGRVLETCMGLAYCTRAILNRPVSDVTVCEILPEVVELARQNPWSQSALDDPRVSVRCASALDVAAEIEPGSIHCVLHDPPTLHRGGELYSGEMYALLFRLLRRGGRLYHYIGTETSLTRRRYRQGVIRRLGEAGFTKIRPAHRGVCAVKRRDGR